MVLYDENTRKYTQVVGCYDKISAVIEFGAIPISSPVTCTSAELSNVVEFCKCNVLVPYTAQLWIRISGYWYPFNVILNKPQIMIISKEESQDQVQVYIEEIIQENPDVDLETNLRTSCEGLTGSNCIDKKYCDLQCGPCLLSCSLFKRGRCDDTNYCEWTVDNICECSGEAPVVGPVCGDGTCNGNEVCSSCSSDCGKCNGLSCNNNGECSSNNCYKNYCRANDCPQDTKCDNDRVVDCGKCLQASCGENSNCASGKCSTMFDTCITV